MSNPVPQNDEVLVGVFITLLVFIAAFITLGAIK